MKSIINSSMTASTNNASANYFVDQKKGELLKNINIERDIKKKRDIIKKVIAYMTLGIDVSSDNEDPMIRGLALRSLCNLRLESVQEYVETPLRHSLGDISPYVRKTGVLGILKLSPALIEAGGYIQLLYEKLQDVDTMVVTNVLLVLDEILLPHGGIVLSHSTLMYLLGRIGEFSEWGLNTILEHLSRYKPSSEDEVFSIMNLLDPLLRTSNSGSILATTKCFLHLTQFIPTAKALQTQVFIRIKPPVLTLITGGTPEIQYVLLKHLELMLERPECRGVFDDEFRQMFVRYNESSHVKYIKLAILPRLAYKSNAVEIANELAEYVMDVDRELCLRAITSLADVAIFVPDIARMILEKLITLMDLDVEAIQCEAMQMIAIVLRKYPALRGLVLPSVPDYLRRLEDSDSRSELIWIIGEYSEELSEAPYMLEKFIDSYSESLPGPVKIQLLTAAMKSFFRRPPEAWSMLGRLLQRMVDDTTHQDVHDRALLYYRMLKYDLQLAESVCRRTRDEATEGSVSEASTSADMALLVKRFNSLAAIYGKDASEFIATDYQLMTSEPSPVRAAVGPGNANDSHSESIRTFESSVRAPSEASVDLDLLDFSSGHNGNGHTDRITSANGHVDLIGRELDVQPNSARLQDIAPEQFQILWGGGRMAALGDDPMVEVYSGLLCRLHSPPDPSTVDLVCEVLSHNKNRVCLLSDYSIARLCTQLSIVASGAKPAPTPNLMFFLYSWGTPRHDARAPMPLFLVQLMIELPQGLVNVIIKSSRTSATDVSGFVDFLKSVFTVFEAH